TKWAKLENSELAHFLDPTELIFEDTPAPPFENDEFIGKVRMLVIGRRLGGWGLRERRPTKFEQTGARRRRRPGHDRCWAQPIAQPWESHDTFQSPSPPDTAGHDLRRQSGLAQ